ncbi:YlxR family protein [Pseudokineococcus basanitobsidens]|uniref:YlxR family protein n=1 Tax=Pseudokineococcus basanitobsidens TaxID=1926649 RepID=A0ABU8RJQ2_9ACTN
MGCRTTTDAADLLRLALVPEPAGAGGPGGGAPAAVVDVRRRLGGRGAWLHPDPACLALAERRRAVPRALRVPGPVDLTAVAEHLAAAERPEDLARPEDPARSEDPARPEDPGAP